jgi:squalene-hopene/tetraprenyl-beta-curcumene cyclase
LGFKKLERDLDVENLLQEGIKLTGPRGAVGAYTISTLLYLMSLKDFTLRYNNEEMIQYYDTNVMKSMQFVEEMYFNRRVPYEGSLDDGRYWDTLLAALALLEAGENIEKLHPTVEFMINTAVQLNGGIPYGQEFEYAPDIDDTAMLLFLYGVMNKQMTGNYSFGTYAQQINRTYTWLKSTQNNDGGFPAFDKDKNDDQYKLIKFIFKITKIDKSA